ncbi:fatty acid desaturase family protein [Nocardia sp. NPDC001965]
MAITEVGVYAHLSPADIEALGNDLDAIRQDIVDQRGARDAAYIRRAIAAQRGLDVVSRLIIALSKGKVGWLLGVGGLAVAKSIENMELGHNICHGQWDWMNDPEIHSRTWEWDMVGLSAQWRYSHNFRHHVYTNVVGMDDDIGFGVMRVTRDQPWRPRRRTLAANAAANTARNLWAYVVIFCGHFPDGAEKFAPSVVEEESKPEWYLRQMLGTANFDAGPVLAFASGNLCYQIEHHLFPDLPGNRYAEISSRVRALCEKYDLPYTTGPLLRQYLLTLRTIHKLALPDRFLIANSDDAPETASERKFYGRDQFEPEDARDSAASAGRARRRGLRSALHTMASPTGITATPGIRRRELRISRRRRKALQH